MPRVTWSAQAKIELVATVSDPTVRAQIKANAKVALHHVQADTADEGADDGVMWRRGITDDECRIRAGWRWEQPDNGTQAWDYFLIYRALGPSWFEVLGVRSTRQIANWELMYRLVGRTAPVASRSA